MIVHLSIDFPSAKVGWFRDSTEEFRYEICGITYSLKEIKYGILRSNRKPPGQFTHVLSAQDPRIVMLEDWDRPKILFVCQDPPFTTCEVFHFSHRMEEQLTAYATNYCNARIVLDRVKGEMILPTIFKTYALDFGVTLPERMVTIWQFYTDCYYSVNFIQAEIDSGKLAIKYSDERPI